MCLAVVLVGPIRGSGIAFALSFASAVNTILLITFLRKNKNIAIRSALGSVLLYVFKLIVISVLAAAPVYFLSPHIQEFFAGNGRLVSYGLPFIINGIAYMLFGILMLAVTRDQYLLGIVNMFKKKRITSEN
jgi:putative peptidoglycan lipid II flippase